MKTLICFALLLGSLSIFANGSVGQNENPDCNELLDGQKKSEKGTPVPATETQSDKKEAIKK